MMLSKHWIAFYVLVLISLSSLNGQVCNLNNPNSCQNGGTCEITYKEYGTLRTLVQQEKCICEYGWTKPNCQQSECNSLSLLE